MRRFAFVLLLLFAVPLFAADTVVFAVRHAEKVADGSADPALTPEGTARAASLARILRDAGITVVYSTPTTRTRTTARPLGIPVTEDASAPEALAARILRENRGKNVLVVDHSNTVPALLKALGIADPPSIADNEHDNLFVVVVPEKGEGRLIRLHY